MRAIEYTASAEADLAGIVEFTLTTWGAGQARRYIEGLETLTARLVEQPALGMSCMDLSPGLRAFPYQSHVLYYLVEPERLIVVRVLHKRMNPSLYVSTDEGF